MFASPKGHWLCSIDTTSSTVIVEFIPPTIVPRALIKSADESGKVAGHFGAMQDRRTNEAAGCNLKPPIIRIVTGNLCILVALQVPFMPPMPEISSKRTLLAMLLFGFRS